MPKMIKRKVNLQDVRNVKLSIAVSEIESKMLEKLSKKLKVSKTECLMLALKNFDLGLKE